MQTNDALPPPPPSFDGMKSVDLGSSSVEVVYGYPLFSKSNKQRNFINMPAIRVTHFCDLIEQGKLKIMRWSLSFIRIFVGLVRSKLRDDAGYEITTEDGFKLFIDDGFEACLEDKHSVFVVVSKDCAVSQPTDNVRINVFT
jgi:hypothetical protein